MGTGRRLSLLALALLLSACGGSIVSGTQSEATRSVSMGSELSTPLGAPPLRLQPAVAEGKALHFQSFVAEGGRLCALTYGGLVFCRDSEGRFIGPLPLSSAADGTIDANPPGLATLRFDGGRLCGLTYGGLLYCEE